MARPRTVPLLALRLSGSRSAMVLMILVVNAPSLHLPRPILLARYGAGLWPRSLSVTPAAAAWRVGGPQIKTPRVTKYPGWLMPKLPQCAMQLRLQCTSNLAICQVQIVPAPYIRRTAFWAEHNRRGCAQNHATGKPRLAMIVDHGQRRGARFTFPGFQALMYGIGIVHSRPFIMARPDKPNQQLLPMQ